MFTQLGFIAKSIYKMGFFYGLLNSLKVLNHKTKSLYVPFTKTKIELRPDTSDVTVYKQIFVWEEYKFHVKFEPKIIIDGGGNIGLSALYFSSRFPEAKIYVLEPDQENFKLLVKNTAHRPNIIPIESALWGSNISFKTDKSGGNWGIQIFADSGEENQTLTIHDLMKNYSIDKIDILKLDIEGAEKDLFKGDLSWLENTKLMVVELHDFLIPNCSKTFFSAIEKINYSLDVSGENIIIENLDL